MATRLTVRFPAEVYDVLTANGEGRPRVVPRIAVEASWFETVKIGDDGTDVVPRTERIESAGPDEVTREIGAPLNDTVTLAILKADGTAGSVRGVRVGNGAAEYTVTTEDVDALLAAESVPVPLPTVRGIRFAQLVPIGAMRPDFAHSTLSVMPVGGATELADEPLGAFGFSEGRSSAVELSDAAAGELGALPWTPVHVGIDGRFTAAFELPVPAETGVAQPTVGWVWWLNGRRAAIGFVRDDLATPNRTPMTIPLPAFVPAGNGAGMEHTATPPAVVTETELVNNPGIYTEDPGAFCRPFSNPERVISEKAFAVIARVQQPDIGPLASAKLKGQHLLDFDPDAVRTDGRDAVTGTLSRRAIGADALAAALVHTRWPVRVHVPPETIEEVSQLPSGRTELSATHPVQWEDNIAQYQAATVALGHILEFRVRTRSNGYSLGNVASTLTLAPRQTKRIQKIEFERIERARREELTQQTDRVSDELLRERDYSDTVSAYLDEWATGSSRSGTAAAAGGFGFAVPPIVGGVGGGTSSAWSSSTQEGQRHAGASEQQRLRDAIRRHGDALRRLQSVVVTEVTQQETVTGTTEVLRNPNYGHSLTVIYYQILRHLAVSTEFAGVRECLFVPFAIRPWTLQRAYRWRDAIRRYLRAPQHAAAVRHLRDVITQFQYSSTLPGTRAQQKLTYLQGSLYLTIAVERPADSGDGQFDAVRWAAISPFLGMPALAVWARLAERAQALRDQEFQREHAPTIAAKWVNSLKLRASGADLQADFTLATRYEFNRTIRVDFSVPASEAAKLDRQRLVDMVVQATTGLPAGSVAKVTRLSMRYGTAGFQRTIDGISGVGDLLEPATAVPDPGADVVCPLDAWDQVDERAAMRHGVSELLEHLNEHVEFYHKAVWWSMDRDRLLMLLDGFYVPGTSNVSLASVVDREPVAIIGNSLVYRVGGGAFLGYGNIRTPAELYALYAGREPAQDPLLLSLPTDGLYAQTIMDECLALEEHHGSVDWVLDDAEPELGTLDPSLLGSRRADVGSTLAPTPMGGTIINLQNAPDAPPPTGLAGVLGAVTSANAFRDMAGLAGTQANAAAALQAAAGLATSFGNQAAALKLAEIADKEKARQTANQQVAAVKSAQDKGLIGADEANQHTNRILEQMHGGSARTAPHENAAIGKAIERVSAPGSGGTVEATTPDGAVKVEFASSAEVAEPETEEIELLSPGDTGEEIATAGPDEQWIILVAGYNYAAHPRGTTTYGTYARNRAALLLANNPAWRSNTNVRFLLINVGEGKAYVDDRAKGSLTDPGNWKAIGALQFAGTSEEVPLMFRGVSASDYPGGRFAYPIETQNGLITPPGWEDRPVFSILHWYNLLRTFGRAAPRTVVEASILSHGTPWGPILVNSFRDPAFMSTTDLLNLSNAARPRDPADVDARADADFVEPTMPAADAQEIQKAFAPGGIVWLWGCSAFGPFKRLVLRLQGQSGYKADGSTPDTTDFDFRFDTTAEGMQHLRNWFASHAFLPASGFTTRRTLGEFTAFLDVVVGTLYAERLARAFKVKCFATALGTGSAPDRGATFVVHHVPVIYEPVVAFYENYMRLKRDPEGRRYVDHKR